MTLLPAELARPASAEDEPAIVAIFASTREAEIAAMPTPEMATMFAASQVAIQRRALAATHPTMVESVILNAAGAVVGRILTAEDAEAVRLLDVALLPVARGGGLGTQILRALQARAAQLARPIALHVEHGRPAARLYARLGFETVGADARHAEMRWTPGA